MLCLCSVIVQPVQALDIDVYSIIGHVLQNEGQYPFAAAHYRFALKVQREISKDIDKLLTYIREKSEKTEDLQKKCIGIIDLLQK